ncbi:hypothetical protein M0812_25089 [Anaeramoeba flamelloides]|uniref:YokE-like PH domain-containing protein n=1 Tax=Anaeramoeba flamelloides TaxID=1746091 RepID=A0AAV7YQK5_9EUKA|nr:hypothetical protein M0812_25089 [Anaeramoeba flamelloides]
MICNNDIYHSFFDQFSMALFPSFHELSINEENQFIILKPNKLINQKKIQCVKRWIANNQPFKEKYDPEKGSFQEIFKKKKKKNTSQNRQRKTVLSESASLLNKPLLEKEEQEIEELKEENHKEVFLVTETENKKGKGKGKAKKRLNEERKEQKENKKEQDQDEILEKYFVDLNNFYYQEFSKKLDEIQIKAQGNEEILLATERLYKRSYFRSGLFWFFIALCLIFFLFLTSIFAVRLTLIILFVIFTCLILIYAKSNATQILIVTTKRFLQVKIGWTKETFVQFPYTEITNAYAKCYDDSSGTLFIRTKNEHFDYPITNIPRVLVLIREIEKRRNF